MSVKDPFPSSIPLYGRIYSAICQIPPGRVSSYGLVARLVGGCSAQMVGFALAALRSRPEEGNVPWQRVINARGKISPHGFGIGSHEQRLRLEEEGVEFDGEGRVDWERFGWPD